MERYIRLLMISILEPSLKNVIHMRLLFILSNVRLKLSFL